VIKKIREAEFSFPFIEIEPQTGIETAERFLKQFTSAI